MIYMELFFITMVLYLKKAEDNILRMQNALETFLTMMPYQTFVCSKPATEMLEKGVKYESVKHHSVVNMTISYLLFLG